MKWLGQPGGFQPHSDLEVALTHSPDEFCVHVPAGYTLGGVVDALGYGEFVTLVSATMPSIDVDLYLTYEATDVMTFWGEATVDLYWEATGGVVEWMVNNPGDHSSHESKSAPVDGTVTIVPDGVAAWADLTEADVIDEDWFTETGELPGPIITFYDEVTVRP